MLLAAPYIVGVNLLQVIPPMSSSTNDAYLGLNKATEYTLKPAYIVGKSAMALELRHFGPRDTSKAMSKLMTTVWLALAFKRCINRLRSRKQPLLIIYASVTGTATRFAGEVGQILRAFANVSFFDACLFDPQNLQVFDLIDQSTIVLFVSSTHGNGDVPPQSQKFFSTLFGERSRSGLLESKSCGVLGFGSSAYPGMCEEWRLGFLRYLANIYFPPTRNLHSLQRRGEVSISSAIVGWRGRNCGKGRVRLC